jgi:hypothetical protein
MSSEKAREKKERSRETFSPGVIGWIINTFQTTTAAAAAQKRAEIQVV